MPSPQRLHIQTTACHPSAHRLVQLLNRRLKAASRSAPSLQKTLLPPLLKLSPGMQLTLPAEFPGPPHYYRQQPNWAAPETTPWRVSRFATSCRQLGKMAPTFLLTSWILLWFKTARIDTRHRWLHGMQVLPIFACSLNYFHLQVGES